MTTRERKVLIEMYRSLEQLPGEIRRGSWVLTPQEIECMASGAEKARVLVYTWLREANMIPHGGR